MVSTPTTRNRLELIGTGDRTNTWGSALNSNVFGLIDEAMDGITTVTVSGPVTLTSQNYVSDQSRKRVLKTTGTGGLITIPSVEKLYLVVNGCSAAITIAPMSGTPATVAAGEMQMVFSDGANCYCLPWLGKAGGVMTGALTLSGAPAANLHAATKQYVDQTAFQSVELPGQAGSAGRFLTTDGTNASWGDVNLALYAPLASPALTGTPTAPTATADTGTTQLATTAFVASAAAGLRGHIAGLKLTNNVTDAVNDIDFAVGVGRDSTNARTLVATSALTKRLDANWAAGNNQGGLDAGSVSNATYFCFAILKDSDLSVDFLFSASPTAPTMPTGYTYFRRIGCIIRAGGTILAFIQDGDVFNLTTSINDITATNPGNSAVTRTITTPAGLRLEAFGTAYIANTGNNAQWLISDLSKTDSTCDISNCTVACNDTSAADATAAGWREFTNTSAQVRSRAGNSGGNVNVKLITRGWIDTRGRDA